MQWFTTVTGVPELVLSVFKHLIYIQGIAVPGNRTNERFPFEDTSKTGTL